MIKDDPAKASESSADILKAIYAFLTSSSIPSLILVLLLCLACAAWVRNKLKEVGLRCDGENGLNWNAILAAQISLWFGVVLLSIVFHLFKMGKITIIKDLVGVLQPFIIPSLILAGLEHHRIEQQSQSRSHAERDDRKQELRWVTYIGYAFALITLSSISLSFWLLLSIVVVLIWLYQQPQYRKKMNSLWASLQAGHKLRSHPVMPEQRIGDITIQGPVGLFKTEVQQGGEEKEISNYEILNVLLQTEKTQAPDLSKSS